MPFNEFERARIERAVEGFMAKRRPPPHLRDKVDLGYRIRGNSVELFEIRPQWSDPSTRREYPFAKTTFVRRQNHWKLFWMMSDLSWHAYPPVPLTTSIEEALQLISEDAHCCFFG